MLKNVTFTYSPPSFSVIFANLVSIFDSPYDLDIFDIASHSLFLIT